MSSRFALGASVLAILVANPAVAQNEADASATSQSDDSAEIVVTAQKRAENVQDVPLAITVVTGSQLATANVRDFSELSRIAPSLSIRPADSAQNANVTIRGIGTFAFGIGVEPAVAIQIDDVPIAFQARAFNDLADIERVEVLRGPQSTLYGKNASAGLINIVTRAPGKEFTGRAAVTATTDSEYRGELSASGPVTDTLRAGFGVSYRTFDGNVRNLTTGQNVNGSDNLALRGRLIWEPTSTLSFDAQVNYARVDADPTYAYRVLSPNIRLRGNASQTRSVVMPGIEPGPDNLDVTLNDQPFFVSEGSGRSLRASWTLPNDLTIVSITADDDYRSRDRIDSDRTASKVIANVADGTFDGDAFSQELRLLSPSASPLRYTLGLFYSDSHQRRGYKRGPAFSLAEWNATSGSQQLAVFGQADWSILPRTTLTLGLRGQREKIDYTFNDLRTAPVAKYAGASSDSVATWRAGVKQDLSNDLMLFASYARGHKGQAYDLTTGFNRARADLGPIRPEKSDAYEIGIRAQMLDRRLTINATVFQVDYRDLQTQSIEDIQGIPTFRLTNVGQSRTQGIEADVLARPFTGLSLFGGVTYIDASFVDFTTAACYPGQSAVQGCTGTPPRQDLSGARLAVPEVKGNVGLDLSVPFGSVAGLIGGQFNWQSRTPSSDPATAIPAYTQLNLTAGVRFGDGGPTIRAFVNNVFDTGYPVALGNQYGNFGNQPAVDFLPGRDFRRYAGIRLSTEF